MKRKAKKPSKPPVTKKQNQSKLPFQPVNRLPTGTQLTDTQLTDTQPIDTDTSGADAPPHSFSLTSPSPSKAPESPVGSMIIDNSKITKPKKSLPFTSLTTPQPMSDGDPLPPKPVKKKKMSKDDLALGIQSLATDIMSGSDKGSATHDHAHLLTDLAETAALQQMKKFSIKQLTLMAKILLKRPTHDIDAPDPRLDELTEMVRDFLIASRPQADPYELQGQKKKDKESVPTGQQVSDTTDWLDSVLHILAADGFNDGQRLDRMRTSIIKLLKTIDSGEAVSEWAELRGYIFQINKAMAARSRYLLKDIELPIVIPDSTTGRFVDTVELVFTRAEPEPLLCFCEYKAYGTKQNPSSELTESFQAQLDDYVANLSQPGQPCHLRYVFPGAAPGWVFPKLRNAARALETAGKKVYLTEGPSTKVIKNENEKDIFGQPKAGSGIITNTKPAKESQIIQTPDTNTTISTQDIQPTASRSLARTTSTPNAVVKKTAVNKTPPKKTPLKKTPPKKKKKKEKTVGQSRLDAFLSTANVGPPTVTTPLGRPRSTSDSGSNST
jgi:hypothetical protein